MKQKTLRSVLLRIVAAIGVAAASARRRRTRMWAAYEAPLHRAARTGLTRLAESQAGGPHSGLPALLRLVVSARSGGIAGPGAGRPIHQVDEQGHNSDQQGDDQHPAQQPDPHHPTHHLFRSTRWSRGEIDAAVMQASRLVTQCGVVVRAELHTVEVPERFHFYSTPVSRELLRQLIVRKPAVFFVEGTRNEPAYDAEAIGRGNAATRPELADTV